jgi:hypothetical protein
VGLMRCMNPEPGHPVRGPPAAARSPVRVGLRPPLDGPPLTPETACGFVAELDQAAREGLTAGQP